MVALNSDKHVELVSLSRRNGYQEEEKDKENEDGYLTMFRMKGFWFFAVLVVGLPLVANVSVVIMALVKDAKVSTSTVCGVCTTYKSSLTICCG